MDFDKKYDYSGYNFKLSEAAKVLRKDMTPHERKLWFCFLKEYEFKFYRQRPIGFYITDFYCSKAGLIIELDGSQHYTVEGKEYDSIRTEVIAQLGLEVIRFTNREIDTNFQGVCRYIDMAVRRRIGNPSVK